MKKNVLACIFLSISSSSFSGSVHHSVTSDWQMALSLLGGTVWNTSGNKQYFPSADPVQDSYYYYNSSASRSMRALGAVFAGMEKAIDADWLLQLGLGYYIPDTLQVNGILTQGPAVIGSGIPDVNASGQYHYSYNIDSSQLLSEGKLLYTMRQSFHPYVSAGIGAAFNKFDHYSVAIEPIYTTLSNHFGANSHTSFSYTLGLGLDVDIASRIRAGIGYRFFDLGAVKSNTSVIDVGGVNTNGIYNPPVLTNNRLQQTHLYLNELVAHLTFLL